MVRQKKEIVHSVLEMRVCGDVRHTSSGSWQEVIDIRLRSQEICNLGL